MEKKVYFLGIAVLPILDTPHSFDIIHIMKNVCESLLATLFDMAGKTNIDQKQDKI
jgi:hypothetical protein